MTQEPKDDESSHVVYIIIPEHVHHRWKLKPTLEECAITITKIKLLTKTVIDYDDTQRNN